MSVKALLVSIIFMSLNQACASNLGHRVGAGPKEYYKNLPENSLIALKTVLQGVNGETPLQMHEDFEYLEFDLQETADGHIVLFHDKDFERMLPNNMVNRETFKKILTDETVKKRVGKKNLKHKHLKIEHLTLAQLKSLTLDAPVADKVPTLEEFLEKCKEWKIVKPMTFEIKRFHSDQARLKLISIVKHFRENYFSKQNIIFEKSFDLDSSGISFLAFNKALNRSFPPKMWCPVFRENGFEKVYQAMFHRIDLCR